MERTVAVLYKGKLAHYTISRESDGVFRASLLKYNGESSNLPPGQILLRKQGRHWGEEEAYQELLDDLGSAIEMNMKENDPLFPKSKKNQE